MIFHNDLLILILNILISYCVNVFFKRLHYSKVSLATELQGFVHKITYTMIILIVKFLTCSTRNQNGNSFNVVPHATRGGLPFVDN